MNPIYRGQYPPKNTNVLWIKDNQIYIYQNGGWKATSGGTADFNAKEGEPGYIANKPLSKTVNTETTTYGSGNTYVDALNAKVGPGEDMFGYIYAVNGGSFEGPGEDYTLKENELYFMRLTMPTEFPKPVKEVVDMGYIGMTGINNLTIFTLIQSWLTEDQQSGGDNYVNIDNSMIFFKPDENIKTPMDLDVAICDIIGLDMKDPSLTPEIVLQALAGHDSEVLAFCDNYIYKTAGGILVITPYAWSEQEQGDVSKAYIADPSNTYMNYWGISSGHKVVENYAMLSDETFSFVCLTPVISEVYGADPTEEQEDAFSDKVAETTLSDYGMSSIVEITTTTTEYQQLEEGYFPDTVFNTEMGNPKIVGKTEEGYPIIECTWSKVIDIRAKQYYIDINPPQNVQDYVNQFFGKTMSYMVIQPLAITAFKYNTNLGKFYSPYDFMSPTYHTVVGGQLKYYGTPWEYTEGMSHSYIRIRTSQSSGQQEDFDSNKVVAQKIKLLIVARFYPTGTFGNGLG